MVIKYDSGAAANYEAEVGSITGRIEGILGDRDDQKKYVQQNYESTGNSEDYDAVETRWLEAGEKVRELVAEAKTLMEKNDVTAAETSRSAGSAIGGMVK